MYTLFVNVITNYTFACAFDWLCIRKENAFLYAMQIFSPHMDHVLTKLSTPKFPDQTQHFSKDVSIRFIQKPRKLFEFVVICSRQNLRDTRPLLVDFVANYKVQLSTTFNRFVYRLSWSTRCAPIIENKSRGSLHGADTFTNTVCALIRCYWSRRPSALCGTLSLQNAVVEVLALMYYAAVITKCHRKYLLGLVTPR